MGPQGHFEGYGTLVLVRLLENLAFNETGLGFLPSYRQLTQSENQQVLG